MMLIELTGPNVAQLPLAGFKDHLRLGTGFADDGSQDTLAESYLRAAMAAVEARIGKAILARDWRLTLQRWRDGASQPLPMAPVSAILAVRLRDRDGGTVVVDPGRYLLVPDLQRPRLVGAGGLLPALALGGSVEIDFTAGFGSAWSSVPPDLAQAVFLLAAQYHERRHEGAEAARAMPFGVMALIERWRTVRALGGGGA